MEYLSTKLMAEVSDWVATYTEVALGSMEHDTLMELIAGYGKEARQIEESQTLSFEIHGGPDSPISTDTTGD